MHRPSPQHLRLCLLIPLVLGFLLFDLFTPMLLSYEPGFTFDFVLLGCCIGQLNLIATWAALAPGNIAVRLPWAMMLATFMWFAFIVGNRLHDTSFLASDAFFLGMLLLVGVIVVQIPLWIARLVFQWRLLPYDVDPATLQARADQYSLRHLLLGMLFFSLTLAPLRLVMPEGEMGFDDSLRFDRLVITLAIAAFCNLVITVPTIWGAFLPVRLLIPMTFAWFIYCGLISTLEYGAYYLFVGDSPEENAHWSLFSLNLFQCLTVLFALLAMRAIGFRLVRYRSKQNPEPVA